MTQVHPIVGAHFRPPAKALLQFLPAQVPLVVQREPDNPHDPNALQVLIAAEDVPVDSDLSVACAGYGIDIDEFLAENPEIHLGYVPRTVMLGLAPKLDAAGLFRLFARLVFTPDGKPAVAFEA